MPRLNESHGNQESPSTLSDVAWRILEARFDFLMPRAVRIFSPLPKQVPLNSCKTLSPELRDFLVRYEPKVECDGLYEHQADLIRKMSKKELRGLILTSTTGSGKSLCFWTWVVGRLLRDPAATALLCFPTQALMWSQSERMAQISEPESLAYYDPGRVVAFGGVLRAATQQIPWSVWKGTGRPPVTDERMREHERSDLFDRARILISTLDKAHFDLIRRKREFVRDLSAIVIDEAHVYQGLFGANVHYFLQRLGVAHNLFNRGQRVEPPPVFLSSATLSDPQEFAARLTGFPQEGFLSIRDKIEPKIDAVDVLELPHLIEESTKLEGIARFVLLLGPTRFDDLGGALLGDEAIIGNAVNAIYFSPSKHTSRLMRLQLASGVKQRQHFVYDADLPPNTRRDIENRFNTGRLSGATILATCALELGVDIQNLDICVMDEPPRCRTAMLQRIGRVGRRVGRPGLAVLSFRSGFSYEQVKDDPAAYFVFDEVRTLPLPTHLEMLKWRHMLAVTDELHEIRDARDYDVNQLFDKAMKQGFGEQCDWVQLQKRFEEKYGEIVDTTERRWAHSGFRAISSAWRVPLVEAAECPNSRFVERRVNGQRSDVAWIEDTQVYRDAHPEAVYLSDQGRRWRVCGYDREFALGRASRTLLPSKVFVQRVSERIYTRGHWRDEYWFATRLELPSDRYRPREGQLDFGFWEFERRWRGYSEYALPTRQFVRRVTVAEVTQRFWQAKEAGDEFPFLHPLRFRTLGWQWKVGGVIPGLQHEDEGDPFTKFLACFLAGSVEAAESDLCVSLDGRKGTIQVLDATRGGSGLSDALLCEGRFASGIDCAIRELKEIVDGQLAANSGGTAELLANAELDVAQVLHAMEYIRSRWSDSRTRNDRS